MKLYRIRCNNIITRRKDIMKMMMMTLYPHTNWLFCIQDHQTFIELSAQGFFSLRVPLNSKFFVLPLKTHHEITCKKEKIMYTVLDLRCIFRP